MGLFLHIGAGKCGSSALQSYLTQSPIVNRNNGSFAEYMALNHRKHKLVRGDFLRKGAGVYGYCASSPIDLILNANLDSIRQELQEQNSDIILSNEGWLHHPELVNDFLTQMDFKATVVIYVRPQVNVLNSAWWQWGAWSGKPFEEWIEKRIKLSLWGSMAQSWTAIPMCKNVVIRPVHHDVIVDFVENVIKGSHSGKSFDENKSLPASVLRLFQRNRNLRPDAHKSAIDFALSKHLNMEEETPWVISPQMCERVIHRTKIDTKKMMGFMEEDIAALVAHDARWWSADAYKDRIFSSPEEGEISPSSLEKMCVQMSEAILELEREVIQLKNRTPSSEIFSTSKTSAISKILYCLRK